SGDAQKYSQALSLLEENLQASPDSLDDRRTKALILAMKPAHHREAIVLFEDLKRRQPLLPDEQFVLAQLYDARADWPRALELVLNLCSNHDENAQYLAYYVDRLLRNKKADEIGIWLTKLEKIEPETWRTTMLKARFLHALNQGEQAAASVRKYA